MKKNKEFIWPEFNSDRDRIRYNTTKYKNVTISEAFADAYNIDITSNEQTDSTPTEPVRGEIIDIRIKNINKNRIELESNIKYQVVSSINLYKYKRFKETVPTETIKAQVMSVDKNKVSVDIITPVVNNWLKPIIDNPVIQKNIKTVVLVKVKDLKRVPGGFTGKAILPTVSEFVGEEFLLDAFIPGSQIVLNITDDFDQFNGQTVDTFILSYINKPDAPGGISLVCSAKEYLKFYGDKCLIKFFGDWCEGGDEWKQISNKEWEGRVTGVINSAKKCGVFVEIPELNITGMVVTKPSELVNYKPRQSVIVKIDGFDEGVYYNSNVSQLQHTVPYVIKNDILEKCNIKPNLIFCK